MKAVHSSSVAGLAGVCCVLLLVCAPAPARGQGQARPCVEGSAPAYTVKRLPQTAQVKISDRALADWDASWVIMEIPFQDAASRQWLRIRGGVRRPVVEKDFAIKVYMAWDDRYYYVAADVFDDAVRAVPATSLYPYSGDCVEIFFAGKQVTSRLDIHDLVESGPSGQAAFFQLEIPPVVLQDPRVHLAEWRADRAFLERAIREGFLASSWVEGSRWRAEVRIPLAAFDDQVLKAVRNGERLKIGFDYLDYDNRTAERTAAQNWGFMPDHVFCLDPEERYVNVPACMRSIVFAK